MQALLDGIPDHDGRVSFVRLILFQMEDYYRRNRTIRPNWISDSFYVEVPAYQGNRDDIVHHGHQIAFRFNAEETRAETLSLIRARARELATANAPQPQPVADAGAAAAAAQPQPPAPIANGDADPPLSGSDERIAQETQTAFARPPASAPSPSLARTPPGFLESGNSGLGSEPQIALGLPLSESTKEDTKPAAKEKLRMEYPRPAPILDRVVAPPPGTGGGSGAAIV